jgi:NADH oxidase (H2O2-forming)
MEKTNVLVIGGGPAAVIAATTGRAFYPEQQFMLVRKHNQVMVPCGIPYVFGTLDQVDKNLMADGSLKNAGVAIKIDEVISIDASSKRCQTAGGLEIEFDKLVLATGSEPVIPQWLEGSNLEKVFTVNKNKEYMQSVKVATESCRKIVVIGGGFIGAEVSDELSKAGKEVTIVEKLPHVLGIAFDEEITVKAEKVLNDRGIKLKNGVGVQKIIGQIAVEGVLLENGERLPADAVILAVGYRPNTQLAATAGLELNERGFIKVDEYMRTSNPDIYAVGDCAEKKDFITRKTSMVMLASTATTEARIAGMNLFKLSSLKTFNGTLSIFATAFGDKGFGVAGLSESAAQKEGFEIICGSFEGVDKHPGTLPDSIPQLVKLIAAKDGGVIIGGEVAGSYSTGEITNLLGFIIQNRMTVNSILTAQIGTHPLLTAAPTVYPLIKAAEMIVKKLRYSNI